MLEIFGMEWRMAVGEAEAELAHLSRLGLIDAVMTDDVDALVFGAKTIIKNTSLSLTGNKSKPALDLTGTESSFHVMVYSADAIKNHLDVQLTRGGLVLIALLSGGDYHNGVPKFGANIAHGLARCGFGNKLLEIYERRGQQDIRPLLSQWRDAIREELRSNARGFQSSKHLSLVLPADFPPMDIMKNYVAPKTSARTGGQAIRDNGEMSLPRLAAFCEVHFGEWGHESRLLERFRRWMWIASIVRLLWRAALEVDEKEKTKRINAGATNWSIRGVLTPARADAAGLPESFVRRHLDMNDADRLRDAFVNRGPQVAPRVEDSNALKMTIVSSRKHASTDHLLEYRVELYPALLVSLARTGIQGLRAEPTGEPQDNDDDPFDVSFAPGTRKKAKTSAKPPAHPDSKVRLWLPASMMQQVYPGLVEDFLAAEATKKAKGKGKKKAKAPLMSDSDGDGSQTERSTARTPRASQSIQGTASSSRSAPDTKLSTWDAEQMHGPTRRNGFLFTFPNPDDPDMVLPEDGFVLPHPSLPLRAASPSRVRAAAPAAASQPPRPLSPEVDPMDAPRDRFDAIFDRIMGLDPARRKSSGRGRKLRVSAAAKRGAPPARVARQANAHNAQAGGSGLGVNKHVPSPPAAEQRSFVSERVPDDLLGRTMGGASSSQHRGRPARCGGPARRGAAPRAVRPTQTLTQTPRNVANEAVLGFGFGDDEEIPVGPPPAGQSLATQRYYDNLFEQAMGSSDRRTARLKPRPLKRPRLSAPVPIAPVPVAPPLLEPPVERPAKRPRISAPVFAPFPDLPTPPRPTSVYPHAARTYVNFQTSKDVVEVFSDPEDIPTPVRLKTSHPPGSGAWSVPSSSTQRGRHIYPEPSFSQDSGFLSDASSFIDLT